MYYDHIDKTILWIPTTTIRLFNGFGQQEKDYLMDSDNKD